LSRGDILAWPVYMYFAEVYHARTAFELLAEREPYEWTHPHLAKEIMALGILAFGDDRIVGHESVPHDGPVAFAVSNEGTRAYVSRDGTVSIASRDGPLRDRAKLGDAAAIALTAKTAGSELYVLDKLGSVHVIAPGTAQETKMLTGGKPGTAMAYAQGPNRLFAARADGPVLDAYDLETGSHDTVSLTNARTG